jgi:hypothetical protein
MQRVSKFSNVYRITRVFEENGVIRSIMIRIRSTTINKRITGKEVYMVRVGIIGATGYAGGELVRILTLDIRMHRSYGLDQEVI